MYSSVVTRFSTSIFYLLFYLKALYALVIKGSVRFWSMKTLVLLERTSCYDKACRELVAYSAFLA